jgi:predicted branched-subunit amino acid permease
LDERGGFTRQGVRRGMRAALAITLGLSPFGLVVGMTSDGVGLSLAETLLMSGLVFAGTSQVVALQLWADPAPILAASLACLVINLRLAPMGAALAPVLDRTRGIRLWGTLLLLVDNSFALTIAELRAGRRDAGYLFGAGFGMWLNWMVMVTIGHVFGTALRLPAGHPVFFAASAAVLALLVQLWRGKTELQPWILAGAVAVMVQGVGLGAPWPVLAGAFAGAGFGAWRDTRSKGGHRA